MKQILTMLFLTVATITFAQQAPISEPPKVFNLTMTEPEINFAYSNLEGVKVLAKKPGERTYTEVNQLVGAIDSLERVIIKYMKVQVDAEKVAADAKDKSKKK